MSEPPAAPRRPRAAAGDPDRVDGGEDDAAVRRGRTGGRRRGQSYAPTPPAQAGAGSAFPYRDYSTVEPRSLRDAYESWQQTVRDIADQRRARRWEQKDVAEAAGIAFNTVQNLEQGQWVQPHVLLRVCSVLDLRVEQTVVVGQPLVQTGSADRSVRSRVRPSLTDRLATRDDVLAGRAVLRSLAAHHQLQPPRIGPDGTVYVRSAVSGFAPLWRFAAVASLTLDAWITVSSDEEAARRTGAERL